MKAIYRPPDDTKKTKLVFYLRGAKEDLSFSLTPNRKKTVPPELEIIVLSHSCVTEA